MKLGLSKKIILAIEFTVFFVALSCGIISLILQKSTLENLTKSQLESVSILKGHSIERYFNNIKEELDSSLDNNHYITYFLETNDQKYKKDIYETFEDILSEGDTFSEVFILNKNGVISASSNTKEEGEARNEEPFFISAKLGTRTNEFIFNNNLQKSELIVAVPILSKDSSFLGVLVSKINIESVSNIVIERSGLGLTGESFVIDLSNRMVTSPPGDNNNIFKIIEYPKIDNCLQGERSFFVDIDYKGNQVFEYLHWLPEIKSCLVTKINTSEAFAPMDKITSYVLVTIGIVSLIIGFIGYILGQSIVRPLKKLGSFAKKLKEGDFKVKVDIKSKDEIGEITNVFNDMADNLSKYTSNLEAQVKSRTLELDQKVIDVEQAKRAVVNLLEDISEEKKRAEGMVVLRTKELNDEKSRLLASINSLDMGFAIVDDSGLVIVNNPSLLSILGFTENIKDIDDISQRLKMKLGLKKRLDFCKEKKCVVEIKEITFEAKFLRVFLTPVFSKGKAGLPIGGVLIVEDITEPKILERSKDEFFAVASHELRTPLTAIRGNTDMLLDMYGEKIKDKEIKGMISDINEASKRLIGIVNDFLDASRLEQGKITLENKKFDILEAIDKVVKSMKESAEEKNLHLEFIRGDLDKLEVFADMEKVEQILFNLIGNSIKFTSVGKVEVSFDVSNGFVKVSISDTGPGISAQNENLLFRKFQPAGEQILVRDVTKSTGLGLYISRLLISKMGGTIGLEKSVVGKGSTFFFTLPLFPV